MPMESTGSERYSQSVDQSHEDAPSQGSFRRNRPEEASLVGLINVLLRYRRLIVIVPTVLFILAIGYAFIRPRTYTVSASFILQTSEPTSLTTGLAAQFGLALPGGSSGQSPVFYAELIKTPEILRTVVGTRYSFSEGTETVSGNLVELFRIHKRRVEVGEETAIEKLKKKISVGAARETGLVNISVTTRWASLSEQITSTLLKLVNEFNLERRQSQAGAERSFIEERLTGVKIELRESENRLEEFLIQNRRFRDTPELEFIYDRLQREVTMRQQVVTSLIQSYEQARIEEVRDTPVITIVESPRAPVRPDSRRLALRGLLAIMLGLVIGIFGSFSSELIQRSRKQDADEFEEFGTLKEATLKDLRRPWRLFLKIPDR